MSADLPHVLIAAVQNVPILKFTAEKVPTVFTRIKEKEQLKQI